MTTVGQGVMVWVEVAWGSLLCPSNIIVVHSTMHGIILWNANYTDLLYSPSVVHNPILSVQYSVCIWGFKNYCVRTDNVLHIYDLFQAMGNSQSSTEHSNTAHWVIRKSVS